MPKLKLNGNVGVDAAKVDAVEGLSTYDGPVPPAGLYPSSVISIKVGESKSKKPMLTAYTKIDVPKDDKKGRHKYNGYLMSDFFVIPEDKEDEHYGLQVGQINRFLDALSGDDMEVRKKFWSGNAVTSADGKKLESIGSVKIKGGVKVSVATKADSYKRKERNEETGKDEIVTVKTLRINDYYPTPKKAKDDAEAVEDETTEDDTEVEYEDAEEGEEPDDSPIVDDADEGDADDEAGDGESDDGDAESDEGDESDAGDSDEDSADDDGAEESDGSDESADEEDDGDIEGVASEVSTDTEDGEVPAAKPRKRRSAF